MSQFHNHAQPAKREQSDTSGSGEFFEKSVPKGNSCSSTRNKIIFYVYILLL